MTARKLPGEPLEDEQLPTGNAGERPDMEGGEVGGKPPPLVDGLYFRGKRKQPPMAEKEGRGGGGKPPAARRRPLLPGKAQAAADGGEGRRKTRRRTARRGHPPTQQREVDYALRRRCLCRCSTLEAEVQPAADDAET